MGVMTGYIGLLINIGFTLLSIPLALKYLDKSQFGIWSLALQINGYLALVDLGMSAATSRYLADFKDDISGGEYGSYLKTGAVVFSIQGFLMVLIGGALSWYAPDWFGVEPMYVQSFRVLLMGLAAVSGLGMIFRALAAPLWAFQRSDVINLAASLSLITTLIVLVLGFHLGFGLYSFLFGQGVAILQSLIIYAVVCWKNGYYPSLQALGKVRVDIFKNVFRFGKDSLLISLGNQFVNATHLMIISKVISVEAAAIYAVSTKFFTMVIQFVNHPISSAASPLTEMYVRGEKNKFERRYWDLIKLCLAVGTIGAVGLAAGNRSVVELWTHQKIQWMWSGDLYFALLVILKGLNGNFIGMFGIVKDWRPVRWILIIEGSFFLFIAVFGAKYFGIVGTLIAAVTANLCVSTLMSFHQARKLIGPWAENGPQLWISFVCVALASGWGWFSDVNDLRFVVSCPVVMIIVTATAVIMWHRIVPEEVRQTTCLKFRNFLDRKKAIVD